MYALMFSNRVGLLSRWCAFVSTSLLVVATGCTFDPKKEFVNPISPPEDITFTVEVNDPNFSDPYYLFQSTHFVFTLQDLTKTITGCEVTVGGTPLTNVTIKHPTVGFNLEPYAYSDGTYAVNMKIRIATQTGSLAEQLGAEYYQSNISFNVKVDRTPPQITTPPTLGYENGGLTMRWGGAAARNFQYVIKRNSGIYNNPLREVYLPGGSEGVFLDTGYVGGEQRFDLYARGIGFGDLKLGTVDTKGLPPPIDFTVTENNRYINLSWTQALINTNGLSLKIESSSGTKTTALANSGDIRLDTLMFGESKSYWLTTTKEGYSQQAYFQIVYSNQLPPLKSFDNLVMLPKSNKFLTLSNGTIYRYSLPTLALEDSLTASDAGLSRFRYLRVRSDETLGTTIGDNNQLISFDPLDFATLNFYSLLIPALPTTGSYELIDRLVLGGMSNNGRVGIILRQNNGMWGMVFNLDTYKVEWASERFFNLDVLYGPEISEQGDYMVFNRYGSLAGDVHRYADSTYQAIGTVAMGVYSFRQGSNELVRVPKIQNIIPTEDFSVDVYTLATLPSDPFAELFKRGSLVIPKTIGEYNFYGAMYEVTPEMMVVRHVNYESRSILKVYDLNTLTEQTHYEAFGPPVYQHRVANGYHFLGSGFIELLR